MNDQISYDANGNVSSIIDGYSGLNTRTMSYDALDRLKTANGVWGAGSFDYDGLDNLRASTVGTRTLTHQIDQAKQRLTGLTGSLSHSFGYDVQGNITSRATAAGTQGFVFDIGNRMTRAENVPGAAGSGVPGTVQYTYDGNGRRAWAAYPDGTHRGFAYGQDGKLLIVGDTVNRRIADWYFYLGDRQIGQIKLFGGAEFVHTDYLGSVVARSTAKEGVSEGLRTHFEPYGRVSSGYLPVGAGFTGHVHDSDTALIQMQQRYYEPLAGRFLSIDPVVTDASTGGNFNRYAYVNNNPYRYNDPTGKLPEAFHTANEMIIGPYGKLADQAFAQGNVLGGIGYSLAGAAFGFGNALMLGQGAAAVKLGTAGAARLGEAAAAKGEAAFFRGAKAGEAPSFVPRAGEFKVDPRTGFVKDTHGVSVFDNLLSVSSKGLVPHRIDQSSIPESLRIIQRGNDLRHFEIVPSPGANLTPQQFINACSSIVCVR